MTEMEQAFEEGKWREEVGRGMKGHLRRMRREQSQEVEKHLDQAVRQMTRGRNRRSTISGILQPKCLYWRLGER